MGRAGASYLAQVTSADTAGSGTSRGARRKAELVEAGVALLLEGGWGALTSRAVADRAGANLGLVHYHFGGFPELKRAVTGAVIAEVFDPVLDVMTAERGWVDGTRAAMALGASALDSHGGRLQAELVTASLGDETIKQQLTEAFAAARTRLTRWLVESGVAADQAAGLSILLVALLDGLLLHRLVDPDLPLDLASAALGELATPPPRAAG